MNGMRSNGWVAWVLLAVLVVVLVVLVPGVMYADLPPRDPPPGGSRGAPVAGFIELRMETAQPGLWAVVQWQDTAGDWHDVENWSAALDSGYQQWGVFPAQFGRGPFRWTIYGGAGGKLLAVSAPFDLPAGDREIVTVSVEM